VFLKNNDDFVLFKLRWLWSLKYQYH
jgi:hypothetical protein